MKVELDNVRIDQEETKGQIRRKDTKLLQKRIESLEAAPPTGPIHVVLWEDNGMLPTDCSLFSLREPSRMDVSHICRWRLLVCIWTAQRGRGCEDSGEATHSVSGSAAVAYYMHRRYSEAYDTVGHPCKAGGTSTRKHKTLSQYRCMRQPITSFDVLKISGCEAWLTRTAISRSPLWMLCR